MNSTEGPTTKTAQTEDNGPKIKQPNRLWLLVLALGLLFDFLFWNYPIGANYAIFSVLCLLSGLFFLIAEGYLYWLLPHTPVFGADVFRQGLWIKVVIVSPVIKCTEYRFTSFLSSNRMTKKLQKKS